MSDAFEGNTDGVKTEVEQARRREVSELKGSEVRWFYKDDGAPSWSIFNGYDSMVLEFAYRKKHDIPLDQEMMELEPEVPSTNAIVLGGLYQANEEMIWADPIYWPPKGYTMALRRGTWFEADTMQPLEEKLAVDIERDHLKFLRDPTIPETPVFSESDPVKSSGKRTAIRTLTLSQSSEVRWHSMDEVVIAKKVRHKVFKFIPHFSSRKSSKTHLRRGYEFTAMFTEGRPHFSDLVLVVHGIGEKKFQFITSNCAELRVSSYDLMDKHYPDEERRPMIIPVEWRSCLIMDEDKVEKITLPRAAGIREGLNSVAMDVIYYQSPHYRIEIVKGVTRCLNATYEKFMRNNPGFNGPVSILAHSLGSVVVYDILTQWTPFRLYEEYVNKALVNYRESEKSCSNEEECRVLDQFREGAQSLFKHDALVERILIAQEGCLNFKVKNLFCVGSPIAVYSIMRGGSRANILPPKEKLQRLFNIFHPSDPVAYRVEPLFNENYRHFSPVKIRDAWVGRSPYKGLGFVLRKSYHRKMKKKEAAIKADREVILSETNGKKQDGEESNSDSDGNTQVEELTGRDGSSTPTSENGKTRLVGVESVLENIPADQRISQRYDFQLEPSNLENLMEYMNIEYLAVYRGHFVYWSHCDFAAFLLNALYEPSVADEMDENGERSGEKPATPL